MPDHFDQWIKRARFAEPARFEAYYSGSPEVEPHHFLLALLREEQSILREASADLREHIRSLFPNRSRLIAFEDVRLSQGSSRVLANAIEEADKLGSLRVEVEHLLIALLREDDSPVALFLRQHGFYAAKIRESLYTASLLDNLPPERVSAARVLLRELRKRQSISLRITGPDLDRTFKFNPEPESPSAR